MKFINFEELQAIEETGLYTVEDNGMSGEYIGYHWFTLINDETGEEIEAYVK